MNIFLENYMPNLYSECAIKCIKLYNISKLSVVTYVSKTPGMMPLKISHNCESRLPN